MDLNLKAKVETSEAEGAIGKLEKAINKLADIQEKTLKEQEDLNKNVTESAKKTEAQLKSTEKATNGLAKGFKGVGLAIKAAGIGLVLGVLNELVGLFKQNQQVTDAFSKAFEGLSIVVNDFIDFITGGGAIQAVGDFFEKLIQNPIDAISGAIDGVKNYTKEVAKSADAKIELANSSRIAQAEQKRLIEQYDREAEQLRQIRDNEELSIEKRTEANDKLGKVLEEQIAAETKLINISVKAAEQAVENNKSIENQVALIEALTQKDELLARVEGFRSEQLINQISLRKQLNEQLGIENERKLRAQEIEPLESRGPEDLSINDDPEVKREAKKADKIYEINEDLNKALTDAIERQAKDEEDIAKKKEATKAGLIQKGFELAGKVAGKNAEAQKGVAAAEATFSTYAAIAAQLKSAAASPGGAIPGYAIAQAIATGVFGFAQVAKILSTPTNSPSSPSVGGGGGGATATVPIEDEQPDIPNFDFINQGVGGGQDAGLNRNVVILQEIKDQEELRTTIDDIGSNP